MTETDHRIRRLAADITSAYVSARRVATGDVPLVIARIAEGLASVVSNDGPTPAPTHISRAKMSAYRIGRSIRPDALISFEDGQPYKALRKHLTARGITPEAYRAKWGLPDDYPMTAEAYRQVRSRLAKKRRLGRKPAQGSFELSA